MSPFREEQVCRTFGKSNFPQVYLFHIWFVSITAIDNSEQLRPQNSDRQQMSGVIRMIVDVLILLALH